MRISHSKCKNAASVSNWPNLPGRNPFITASDTSYLDFTDLNNFYSNVEAGTLCSPDSARTDGPEARSKCKNCNKFIPV